MALFSIKSDELPMMVVVSSNCIGCVRSAAIAISPVEEHEIWQDPYRSMVKIESFVDSGEQITATRVKKDGSDG